ncbi:MAG: ATP-dependent DNA helicase RecG [Clostridia bacterium]|nr:ATP-dependent DNA helicase RecG [Clostridia bacterium]
MLSDKITTLKGIGQTTAKKLEKLGIFTLHDMLYHFPFRNEDRSEVRKIAEVADGESVCIRATVFSAPEVRRIRKNFAVYTLILRDDSGFINAVWYNNKYVMKNFTVGKTYTFFGQIKISYGKKEIITPVYETEEKNLATGRIVPVYNLTAGLSQKTMQATAKQCLDAALPEITETLPPHIREENSLCEIKYALSNIHFPESANAFSVARRRLVFEEFFLLNLGMRLLSGRRNTLTGIAFPDTDVSPFLKNLPYEFTGAQKRVVSEICDDLMRQTPMNRLVQGDVGSGKTAVGAASLYLAYKNGHQGAMMAPTEILARQHFESLKSMLPGIPICLLTGSTKAKERRETIEKLKSGEIKIAVGTHALFSEDVAFSDLALVITDEQHRFGVKQRAALAEKSGASPHILVMTATPIPRTLALILYSDLDISVIDELPPGRQQIKTYVVGEDMRKRIYAFIEKNINLGNQAYIVCPMVEESDTMELKSVVEFAERLKNEVFPSISVGFIHGKMKNAEKDEIMSSFLSGDIKILVSTTVIEVGVNVPNATLMVVENAERFGLAQLHQLRGRVGRGRDQSYCVLFTGSDSKETKERMDIMAMTTDGFKIAEKDLELRGPGEIFGTRQHGLPEMKIGDISNDSDILNMANKAADNLLKKDPLLKAEENALIRKALRDMFTSKGADGMFN